MEKDLTQKGQFLRCLFRLGGGGLTPNEILSHSNGKFVFDHGPYFNEFVNVILDRSVQHIQHLSLYLCNFIQMLINC